MENNIITKEEITKQSPNKMKVGPTSKDRLEPQDAAYNPMDKIFRLIMGDFPSVSNSWPGEYGEASLANIQKAQQAKYEKITLNTLA